MMNRIGRERGFVGMDRTGFDASRSLRGANFVGSPHEVVDKILFQHEIFRHERFLLQVIGGGMPHGQVMRSIELFGTEVAPAVRAAVGGAAHGAAPAVGGAAVGGAAVGGAAVGAAPAV